MHNSSLNDTTKDFIRDHLNDDTKQLLLRKAPQGVDIKFAVRQIEGWQKAQGKLPTLAACPDFIFPSQLSMEQCSSESTAAYKSLLFNSKSVVDITGGLGIDAYYISQHATSVDYVERGEELSNIAQHNFAALSAYNVATRCGDGVQFLQNTSQHFDAIYLDPARRDSNKNKVVRLADCEPNVLEYLDFFFSKADEVVLKASPMLDIVQALRELKLVTEVHVVAVKNECKELLFVCKKEESRPLIRCVNIRVDEMQQFDFTLEEENSATSQYAEQPKRYLYEPNVSLLKAGAFKLPCIRFALQKLHPDTHLYTSDTLISDFPGRIFEVQQTFALNDAELKFYLPDMMANIAVRNFPVSVADIRKKYKIKDGGNVYLFAATFYNGERRVVKTLKAL